ncbi:MAG: hypothetical protein IJ146_04970, partial [Kiritimatiellae bacterium]|nr:hypothetical protein [Kiritimatiellia bacterium]
VSIHARAWRATFDEASTAVVMEFQFTPARGGRRAALTTATATSTVSIHARAWRATAENC